MIIFAFHVLIALLLIYIVVDIARRSLPNRVLIPLLGILGLFAFHCAMFRYSCIECSLSNPTCVIEIVVFWILAIWVGIEYWASEKRVA